MRSDYEEESDVDFLRGYECPNGCDVVDVLTEDDAMALVVSDPMLCPICDEELERSEESVRDLIAFVDGQETHMDWQVGDVGYVDAHADVLSALHFDNDVGGTSQLPAGRYRIELVRFFDDYETGWRMVGRLLDGEDIATATRVGTTGHGSDEQPYRPEIVYFSGSQWRPAEAPSPKIR